ncbi:fluoride efflux transporter CrcB [Sphingomonas sp. CJ20]
MPSLFLVMLGGAVGSGARYLVGTGATALFGPGFPWGTLAVNLIGGLLMGVLVGTLARIGQGTDTLRLLLAIGVLGGFTTFSSFSLDTMSMLQRGDWPTALGYILASVIGSIAALALGLQFVKAVA